MADERLWYTKKGFCIIFVFADKKVIGCIKLFPNIPDGDPIDSSKEWSL